MLCACRDTAQMNLIAAVYRSLTVFNLKRGCLFLFDSSTNQTKQLQVLSVNSFLFEKDQLSCRTIIREEVWENWRGPWCKLYFGNVLFWECTFTFPSSSLAENPFLTIYIYSALSHACTLPQHNTSLALLQWIWKHMKCSTECDHLVWIINTLSPCWNSLCACNWLHHSWL